MLSHLFYSEKWRRWCPSWSRSTSARWCRRSSATSGLAFRRQAGDRSSPSGVLTRPWRWTIRVTTTITGSFINDVTMCNPFWNYRVCQRLWPSLYFLPIWSFVLRYVFLYWQSPDSYRPKIFSTTPNLKELSLNDVTESRPVKLQSEISYNRQQIGILF